MLLSIFVIIASFERLDTPTFQYLPKESFQSREACEQALTNYLHNMRYSYKATAFTETHTFRVFEVRSINHDNKKYYDAKLTCVEVTSQK